MKERIYTAEEAAMECRVSVALVKRIAAQRGIGTKLGRAWLFTDKDLKRIREREDLRRTKKYAPRQ